MKVALKASRSIGVLALLLSVAAVGVAALVEGSGKVYSILEKAFYLTAEEGVWIRPGLNLEIKSVYIPASRQPVVIFRITDDNGQPLDREGNVTPGSVSTSFIMAYIPQDASQYVAYTTRPQTSPITGVTAVQASTDSGGKYTSQGDGNYMYQFNTVLPANFDQTATHTVGIYATRDLTEFGLSTYYSNEVKNFVPDGSPVTKIHDVVGTAGCNLCHDPLEAHGGPRQKVELCVLCHQPQTFDPDTGNTVDMPVMVHKIHMGPNLPSGKPYVIIGYRQSVNDYGDVTYPQDIRNCTQCHQDALQVNDWLLNPTRVTCGSCHDNVNFATGENHPGGPQQNDAYCSDCHWPEESMEYDASIPGAHTVPYKSKQLLNPEYHLLSITDTAPGQKPTVKFKITDKTGAIMPPSTFSAPNGRLALTIAGPTTDYRMYFQEAVDQAPFNQADGTATYTFTNGIPSDAKGTFSLGMEGRLNTTLNPDTTKAFVWQESPVNVILDFAVTDPEPVPRRMVVDENYCYRCHNILLLHGNNRNQVVYCVFCHNPADTDSSQRPASADPPQAINMSILVHKIHTGMDLTTDYTIYGFGGRPVNFNEVTYPGDRRDCVKCHLAGTYVPPLPSTLTPVTTPRNYWNPTLPTAAACLACHDTVEAAAHAYVNTAPFGESCAVCHEDGAAFGVDQVHAR